jgi:hypothetical protein
VRKAIVSLATGAQAPLLSLALTTVMPYARRHGWEVHLCPLVLAPERPPAWSKIVALQRLQRDYDLLLWLDADLMVVDGREDIAAELEPGPFLYLVEHTTKEGRLPNTGVMMLRTGEDCARFLEEVWAQEDLIGHQWWENAAVSRLLGYELDPPRPAASTEWSERTRWLPRRWNSIPDDRDPEPRIRHYPGYAPRTRAAFMARDLVTAAMRRALARG